MAIVFEGGINVGPGIDIGGGGGFNQLRMWSRSSGSEVQTANIGFIKVYDGVLDLATVQSLYATYKARFGY